MNQYYNQNYTHEDINEILYKIKHCVEMDRYIISYNENRQENIDFINDYNINRNKQKSILMQIRLEDFCYSLQNTKIGYEYEVLYVFASQVLLFNLDGDEENVCVYIKFNIIDSSTGDKVIVISFHKANNPVNYLFT